MFTVTPYPHAILPYHQPTTLPTSDLVARFHIATVHVRRQIRLKLRFATLGYNSLSEYQDTRRSEDPWDMPSDTDTPQQDDPDFPPPPELVQSIKSAGGDLPACDAVILQNL